MPPYRRRLKRRQNAASPMLHEAVRSAFRLLSGSAPIAQADRERVAQQLYEALDQVGDTAEVARIEFSTTAKTGDLILGYVREEQRLHPASVPHAQLRQLVGRGVRKTKMRYFFDLDEVHEPLRLLVQILDKKHPPSARQALVRVMESIKERLDLHPLIRLAEQAP